MNDADLMPPAPNGPPELRGPRLLLRPVTDADRGRLLEILDEPEVARWWRRDEWGRLVDDHAATFAIVLREERPAAPSALSTAARSAQPSAPPGSVPSAVVGMIQYEEETDPDYRSAAVDLFITSAVHGRGLGPEAIRVLLRHLIAAHGHRRFTIDPAVENERAIRSYTKVGFRAVGVMRQYERVVAGTYRDALLMDLLADELTPDPPAAR